MTAVRHKQFETFAGPHSWLLSAEDLHEQILILRKQRGRLILTELDHNNRLVNQLDGADRACFLLAGFCLENLLKGLIIHNNCKLIENGQLHSKVKTHDLRKLLRDANVADATLKDLEFADLISDGIVSWARYPCDLNVDRTDRPHTFSETLWETYVSLYSRLQTRLKNLLEAGWTSPSGQFSRYVFQ
ncbi:hypothetical protein [Rhizobium oryzicola]|uniref:HEPN domain-containing protein n=1 Tax=Rhizobium oryzicola TaxID=1232668 RepID=A0ABT8SV54_9HYPH|nr:hypothetical protein [Rhizobium oryzicola]MDO1582185.1 hypothetical protein [Rhizobium oryzicola]